MLALVAERARCATPEAVLLVDHRQAQHAAARPIGEQRVRADHDR